MPTRNPRPSPYIGPRAYQTGETLYGRDYELRHLLDTLIAERLVLLFSPSGAGKTSLIQAGVIPSMAEMKFHLWPVLRVTLAPPEAHKDQPAFNRYIFSLLRSLEEAFPAAQQIPDDQLAGMSLDEYFTRRPLAESETQTELLIFDQFEEILTLDPTDQEIKAAFFEQIGDLLLDRRRWALFAIREDYLAGLDPYMDAIPTHLSTTFRLDLLGVEGAREAIQNPARQAGVDFTDAAAERLVDDLRQVQVQQPDGKMLPQPGPYVEPVQLQVVCDHLWRNLAPDQVEISVDDILSVGDVDESLASYYAEGVRLAASETGVKERRIREWVNDQLITGYGLRGQVLMEPEQSAGLDNRAIRFLQNVFLVRGEKRRGAIWFELVHDRLVKPASRDNARWMEEHLNLLQRQAALWERSSRPDSLLLRGKELEEAEQWAEAHKDEVTEIERALLDASCELHDREAEALKLAAAQERAEAASQQAALEARSARQFRLLAVVIAVVAILALFMAVLAVSFWRQSNQTAIEAQRASTRAVEQQHIAETASAQESLLRIAAESATEREKFLRQSAEIARKLENEQRAAAEMNAQEAIQNAKNAQEQANIAFSRQLASQAQSYLDTKPDLASLLGVEAYRIADTQEARNVLFNRLQRAASQTIQPYGQLIPRQNTDIKIVALSPDGERLAWGDIDGEVVIWNYRKGEVEQRHHLHADKNGEVLGLVFTLDGKTLISGGSDANIYVWDIASGQSTRLIGVVAKVYSLAISPDGKRLAAGVGSKIVIWDLPSRQVVRDLFFHTDVVTDVAWSSSGLLASSSFDERAVVWNPDNGEKKFILEDQNEDVYSVAWSPDGRFLASGAVGGSVIVWDITQNPVKPRGLRDHGIYNIYQVAFSPDGRFLASAGGDRTVVLTDLRTFQPVSRLEHFFDNGVQTVAFSPHQQPLLMASGSFDNKVGLHQVSTEQPLEEFLADGEGAVIALGLRPDGTLLVLRRGQAGLQVSALQDNQEQQLFTLDASAIPGTILSAAFGPEGRQFALGGQDGGLHILEVESQKVVQSLSAAGAVSSLAISPDGRLLATGQCSQTYQEGSQEICQESEVVVWDLASGQPVGQPFTGQGNFIRSLAFSPDGKSLASGSQDSTILIWDLQTRQPVGLPLARHSQSVTSLAFSPDGSMLASGSADHSLILWYVKTLQPLGEPLSTSDTTLLSLAYGEMGLFSGSEAGSLRRWDASIVSWITRACLLAGRNLSEQEWDQFLPELEYQTTCPG